MSETLTSRSDHTVGPSQEECPPLPLQPCPERWLQCHPGRPQALEVTLTTQLSTPEAMSFSSVELEASLSELTSGPLSLGPGPLLGPSRAQVPSLHAWCPPAPASCLQAQPPSLCHHAVHQILFLLGPVRLLGSQPHLISCSLGSRAERDRGFSCSHGLFTAPSLNTKKMQKSMMRVGPALS